MFQGWQVDSQLIAFHQTSKIGPFRNLEFQNMLASHFLHITKLSKPIQGISITFLSHKKTIKTNARVSITWVMWSIKWFLRASPVILSMWPWILKLGEEKSKHAGLAQQNGFSPAFLHSLLRLVKGSCAPARAECNKYDLTAAPCFWLANHNDWSMWFAISSLPPICSPSFLFYG